jgi:hypothetical protein
MKTIVDGYLYLKGGYAIQGDSLCVTLYKERVTKKGQKQLDVIGYYPNIPQAFDRLIDTELNQAPDLQYLNDKIAELKTWAEDLLKSALTTPSEVRSEELAQKATKDLDQWKKGRGKASKGKK